MPNQEEIEFALQIFKELVEPTLQRLEDLLEDGKRLSRYKCPHIDGYSGHSRDAIWRNDFCRSVYIFQEDHFVYESCLVSHLTIVRNAFAGIPTFFKENLTPEEIYEASLTSDIL